MTQSEAGIVHGMEGDVINSISEADTRYVLDVRQKNIKIVRLIV